MEAEDEGSKDLSDIAEDDGSMMERGHEDHEYEISGGAAANDDLERGLSNDDSLAIFGRTSSQDELPVQRHTEVMAERFQQDTAGSVDQATETASRVVVRRYIQVDSQLSSSGGQSGREVSLVGDVLSDISDEGSLLVGLASPGEKELALTASSLGANSDIESQKSVSRTNALTDSRKNDVPLTGCVAQVQPSIRADGAAEHAGSGNLLTRRTETVGIILPNEPHIYSQKPTRTIATQTDKDDSGQIYNLANVSSAEMEGSAGIQRSLLAKEGGSFHDMMMDNSILSDMDQNQHKPTSEHPRSATTERQCSPDNDHQCNPDNRQKRSPDKCLAIIDTDTGLDKSQHSDGSGLEAVTSEPKEQKRKKHAKTLKMGRKRRHKRKQPQKLLELPFVDAKMDLSENSGTNDEMDFLDSRSSLSDEEAGVGDAMEWSGTVPWGLEDDLSPSTKRTTASEVMEQRMRVASFVLYHVTTHWPQLLSILHWEKSPNFFASSLIFGMIVMRWCGRQQHRRPIATSATSAVGYAIWAAAGSFHDSLVFIGLFLASVHEPIQPTNTRLRQGCVVISYVFGGILYEAWGNIGVGAAGSTLLAIDVGVLYALDKTERNRLIASESTSRLSIVVSNEVLPTIIEHEERATLASVIQTCSVSAIHGLVTTTIPWLIAFEYGWTNVIFLGGLFAAAATAVPIVSSVLASRFATYALTYATLLTGLPYRGPFVVGFLLLPSCMKAVPTSPLMDASAFLAYGLAASSSPLLFIAMPHAPTVVACCIAFVASMVEFLAKSSRKTATGDSLPPSSLHALQKTLF